MNDVWYLYMVRCGDNSLYTGIALDVDRRFGEHCSGRGRGSKYLRGRAPLNLVFHFPAGERSRALRLERTIKTLPKAVKESLCAGLVTIDEIINPDLSV